MSASHILLVEDNDVNAYLATFLLTRHGLAVERARDGVECLAAVRAAPPAVVLMDLQMPRMDGFEAARALLADPATRDVPLIAVSAFAMAGDRTRALAMGFADYIEKPYDPQQFVACVSGYLKPPLAPETPLP